MMPNWWESRPNTTMPNQDAQEFLQRFYENWGAAFRGSGSLDPARLADWLARNFNTIEQAVMGRPEDPIHLGLVAVGQAEVCLGVAGGYSVLSRAKRFVKALPFDSPNVAYFPAEDLAVQAAERARNRCAEVPLFFVHLNVCLMPVPSGDGETFAAETRVRMRAVYPGPTQR